MEGEFKYRESAERTPLHQNPQSVYFYITSADSTTRALAILGRFLRTKRECNQKSGRVFPVTPGNPVVVTVRYLIIEDEKHKDYGIRTISEGHVLVSKGMTRNFPARVTFGETNVYFRKPTTLEYNIYQVLNDFFLYTVLDDGQVMKVQINLRLYGAEDQDQNEAANAEDAEEQIQCDPMKEELKVMEIRKSKSSSPHEPVLDPDDDEDDQGIESTNYQSKPISTTNTFDIEEFLSKRGEGDEAQDEQESDVLELTGSMKDLFLEIRTSSRSSGSISISSKSAEILVSKMEKIDGNLQNNMLILKERIQHLESENKCLREHYQQSMDDMKAQMEKMKEEFKAEIERLQAELQASYATQQNHIVTKKIKIDDIPLSSSQILAKKRSMPPKENQDLSSSRMSLFPQQSKENKPKFYQEVEEVGKEMEEEESDPKLHLEIPVKLVNETWRQKLDLLLLGKKESGSNCKLAYGIDEEIIDSFINKYQEEKQEEIFYFKVSTIDKIIRNKGTSQLRYDENYFSCKYIIAPVSIEEKKGKHYSLLIISNNGNWINGPYIIQAWSYDSKGFSEPKDATVKILKYLLDCKRKKHGSGEHFNTQISAKKIPVAKELSFNESAFHMLYHLKEFSLYKNKYIPSKKSLDLSRFRQDLYNMLLYRK